MPGVSKENIKINVYDNSVEVTATDTEKRKYHEVIEVPAETDIETATSTYKNGILEITFKKKGANKTKRKAGKDSIKSFSFSFLTYFIFLLKNIQYEL